MWYKTCSRPNSLSQCITSFTASSDDVLDLRFPFITSSDDILDLRFFGEPPNSSSDDDDRFDDDPAGTNGFTGFAEEFLFFFSDTSWNTFFREEVKYFLLLSLENMSSSGSRLRGDLALVTDFLGNLEPDFFCLFNTGSCLCDGIPFYFFLGF